MEKETVEVFGKYVFTREEKELKSQDLADAIHAKDVKEYEKKEAMKAFAAEIENLNGQIRTLGTQVRDGFEMRYIKCTVERDYTRRMKSFVSVETGDVVKREPFSEDDYQMRMAL